MKYGKDDRQSRLIESMLLKIPIPAFYMDAANDSKWLVVDGLQRLNAIKRFVNTGELALTGLEFMNELEGKKFSELSRDLQRRIEETDIVIYQIKRGTPDVVRYAIFNRINTGGTPLSSQEIRHALNPGPMLKFLKTLAESKEFLAATREGISQRRMDDQECILRFIAFNFLPPEQYKSQDFDSFLNKAMEIGNKLSEPKQEELSKRFIRAMEVSRKVFQDRAFRKEGSRINKALFEAVAVNIGNLTFEQQEILIKKRSQTIKKMKDLMNKDKKFFDAISQSTTSISKIHYRFLAVKAVFNAIINV